MRKTEPRLQRRGVAARSAADPAGAGHHGGLLGVPAVRQPRLRPGVARDRPRDRAAREAGGGQAAAGALRRGSQHPADGCAGPAVLPGRGRRRRAAGRRADPAAAAGLAAGCRRAPVLRGPGARRGRAPGGCAYADPRERRRAGARAGGGDLEQAPAPGLRDGGQRGAAAAADRDGHRRRVGRRVARAGPCSACGTRCPTARTWT